MGDTTADRTGLLVLGMHRSGTSALTGALGDLGVTMPNDKMAAAPMNPKGFMESDSITALDDDLLAAAGTSWFDWRPFDVRDVDAETLDTFRQRAVNALEAAYGDSTLFALKDPRICRLVPFWTDVFAAAGVRPTFLCVHRHPAEVASSLDTWASYAPAYSGLLWLRYVLDAEKATRGMPRIFTSYARVLDDWSVVVNRISEELDVELPPVGAEETPSFLDQSLHRSKQENTGIELASPWVRAAYDILERWAAKGEVADDHAILDGLRETLDAVSPAIDAIVDSGREADIRARHLEARARNAVRLEHDLEETERQYERLKRESATDMRSKIVESMTALRTAEAAAARDREANQELTEELERTQEEARETARQLDTLRRAAAMELRSSIAQVVQARGQADEARERAEQELAKCRRALERARQRRKDEETAFLESSSWRVTAPMRRVSEWLQRARSRT